MPITFQVNLLSGEPLNIQIDENETADALRKKIIGQWPITSGGISELDYLEIKLVVGSNTPPESNLDWYKLRITDFIEKLGIDNDVTMHQVTAIRQNLSIEAKRILDRERPRSEIVNIFRNLNKNARANKDIVLAAVKRDGDAFEYAAAELKSNRAFVLEAVKQDARALLWAADELKCDRAFILTAVKQNAWVLEWAADEFKRDRDVVLEAVKQCATALQKDLSLEVLNFYKEKAARISINLDGWVSMLEPLRILLIDPNAFSAPKKSSRMTTQFENTTAISFASQEFNKTAERESPKQRQ